MLAFKSSKSNFNVSQIVIPFADEDNERRELIVEKLNELKKSTARYENQSQFAIQITCLSRGQAYYWNEESYEAIMFKKIFPKVPLTGLFGYGELGVDFLINSSYSNDVDWIGYSTIISLVSF